MAKITRYQGDLEAFGSNAVGQERVIFGDTNATQSDDLTANITAALLRGWGALALGNKPPREWFNSVHWVSTQLSAYLHQMGVAEWHVDQQYHKDSCANYNGSLVMSLADNNTGFDPVSNSDKWKFIAVNVSTTQELINSNLKIPVGATVHTNGFYEEGDGGAAVWLSTGNTIAASQTPSLTGDKTCSNSNGDEYTIPSSDIINVKSLGAIGDGSDSSAIFDIVKSFGGKVLIPNGSYTANPLSLSSGTELIGESRDGAILSIDTDRNEVSIWILESNCAVENMTVNVNMSNIGSGTNGTIVTVGLGTGIETPLQEVKNVRIRNIKGINNGEPCNAITAIGNITGIEIENVVADGFLQGIVCHWGSNRNADLSFIETYYPNNISIDNVFFENLQEDALFISACYNVKVYGLTAINCGSVLSVIAGDSVGAPLSITENILSNVKIEKIYGEGIGLPNAITLDGEGHDPISDLWGRVSFKGVTITDAYIETGIDGPGVLITDADGALISDVYIKAGDLTSDVIAANVRLSKNTRINNLSTNAQSGVAIDRSVNTVIDGNKYENSTLAPATSGLNVSGFIYSSTLSSSEIVGSESITISSPFPIRVYKGDELRLSSDDSKVMIVADHFVSSNVIAIEPLDFPVTSGDSIFLDKRSKNVTVEKCAYYDYDKVGSNDGSQGNQDDVYGVSVSSCVISGSSDVFNFPNTKNVTVFNNRDGDGGNIVTSFTPSINGATVTISSATGVISHSPGSVYFEIDVSYSSLDTSDPSAIRIDGLPIAPLVDGAGVAQVSTQLSTGLSLSAGDDRRFEIYKDAPSLVMTSSDGSLVAYNSGAISSTGRIFISGTYRV